MPHMKVHTNEKTRVLGPCPGCECWTVEYCDSLVTGPHPLFPSWDSFLEHMEFILQEHMAECSGLREIYSTL